MSNFKFPSPAGFTPTAREVRRSGSTYVTGHVRSKPGFAHGGRVDKRSLAGREEPANQLDEESGGKTPLRPGYNKGGKAKYAEGGKVGKLRSAIAARKKPLTDRVNYDDLDFRDLKKKGYSNKKIKEIWDRDDQIENSVGPPKNKLAEGGKVGKVSQFFKNMDDRNLKAQLRSAQATLRQALSDSDSQMSSRAQKIMSQIRQELSLRKTSPDPQAEASRVDRSQRLAQEASDRYEASRGKRGATGDQSEEAGRKMKLDTFAKGGKASRGFNRKPMIGK
jgi:hypothetical protein